MTTAAPGEKLILSVVVRCNCLSMQDGYRDILVEVSPVELERVCVPTLVKDPPVRGQGVIP